MSFALYLWRMFTLRVGAAVRRCLAVATVLSLWSPVVQAQVSWPSPEAEQVYQQGRDYLSKGAVRQAVVTYKQALQLAPDVPLVRRDLGQAYYLSGNYKDAIAMLEPLIDNGQADENVYQIAAASLAANDEQKKAKNLLRRGIDRSARKGLLYHELGLIYEQEKDRETALKTWLEGIEKDPGYHVNYYEATRQYMYTTQMIWAIVYGEAFINMERQTPRSNEVRKMLLAAYKRFFFMPDEKEKKKKIAEGSAGTFEDAVSEVLNRQFPAVADGITTENLIMLRTRFIMDWNQDYAVRFPYAVFAYQDALLRDGQYDAYNQFLYAKAENAQQLASWNQFHPEAMSSFEAWAQAHPLKSYGGGFYNPKKTKDIFLKTTKN